MLRTWPGLSPPEWHSSDNSPCKRRKEGEREKEEERKEGGRKKERMKYSGTHQGLGSPECLAHSCSLTSWSSSPPLPLHSSPRAFALAASCVWSLSSRFRTAFSPCYTDPCWNLLRLISVTSSSHSPVTLSAPTALIFFHSRTESRLFYLCVHCLNFPTGMSAPGGKGPLCQ